MEVFSQYKGFSRIFKRYWNAYGGFAGILKSPYMHVSLVITIFSSGNWLETDWFDTPISVLPNIIGFSLGGYAIWLALGDDKFRKSISGSTNNGKESPFIQVNASFVHFIFLQITALLTALLIKSEPLTHSPIIIQRFFLEICPQLYEFSLYLKVVGAFFGYFLFIYAILSALAATFAIFRIAGWLETYHVRQKQKEKEKDQVSSGE